MVWFFGNRDNDNELGEYLPDDEATLQEGSEYLEADSEPEAEKKCKEIAAQYDAVESKVKEVNDSNGWDCKFKFWG